MSQNTLLAKVREKVDRIGTGITGAASLTWAMYNITLAGIHCEWITGESVSVGKPEAQSVLDNVMGIIGGIFIAVGLFLLVSGIFGYLEAKSEDNAMAENKAVKKMAIGIAFTLAPVIIGKIFGG